MSSHFLGDCIMLNKNDILYVLERSVDLMAAAVVKKFRYDRILSEFENGFNSKYAVIVKELLNDNIPYIIGTQSKRTDAIKVAAVLKYSVQHDCLFSMLNLLYEKDIQPYHGVINAFCSYAETAENDLSGIYGWFREQELNGCFGLEEGVFSLWIMASQENHSELNQKAVDYFAAFLSVSLEQQCSDNLLNTDAISNSIIDKLRLKNPVDLNNVYLHEMLFVDKDYENMPVPFIPEIFNICFSKNGLNFKEMLPSLITKKDVMSIKDVSLKCLYREDEEEYPVQFTGAEIEQSKDALAMYNINFFIAMNASIMAQQLVNEIKQGIRLEIFGTQKETNREAFLEETILKLQEQLKKCENDLAIMSEQKNSAEERLISSKNREAALMIQLNKAVSDSHTCVNDNSYENISDSEEIQQENTDNAEKVAAINYSEEIRCILEKKNIVFFGGNANLIKKLRQLYPKIVFIEKNDSSLTSDLMRNCDLAIIKTDNCSHSLYRKMKSLVTQHNVPYFYMGNITALHLIEKEMYECLVKTCNL